MSVTRFRNLLRLPSIGFLHGRGLLLPLVLLAAVAGLLVLGVWERNAGKEPVPEREAARQEVQPSSTAPVAAPVVGVPPRPVARALDKAPLTYFADYWAQLAARTGPRLTAVGPGRTPGLVVGPRLVLTTIQPVLEVRAARARAHLAGAAEGRAAPPELEGFRLRGWDEEIGLAVFDVLGDDRSPFTLKDPHLLPSGSHVGVVTLSRSGEAIVAPGHLVEATSDAGGTAGGGDLAIATDFPEALAIGAVVDLDGGLLGLVYRSPAGRRVFSSTGLLRLIERLQGGTVCRGIEVTDLDAAVREALVLEEGVLIEYVHPGAFAPEPSLRGGDILIEWAGERVHTAEAFEQLYDARPAGEIVRYRVLRNRRRIDGGTIMPDGDCRPVETPAVRLAAQGLALEWVPAAEESAGAGGWRVAAVATAGPAAAAGVAEGDWVVAVGGSPVEAADDQDAIVAAADRLDPLLLLLRRGDRFRLVAVAPAGSRPAAALSRELSGVPAATAPT